MNEFREVDEVNVHIQGASVVGYIREVFGIEAIRSIWQEGPAVLPQVTGLDIASLEREWRIFLAEVPAATAALESVRTGGCL